MMVVRGIVQDWEEQLLSRVPLSERGQQSVVQPLYVDAPVHVVVVVAVAFISLVDQLTGQRALVHATVVNGGIDVQPAIMSNACSSTRRLPLPPGRTTSFFSGESGWYQVNWRAC